MRLYALTASESSRKTNRPMRWCFHNGLHAAVYELDKDAMQKGLWILNSWIPPHRPGAVRYLVIAQLASTFIERLDIVASLATASRYKD